MLPVKPLQRRDDCAGVFAGAQVAIVVLIEVVERLFDDLLVKPSRGRGDRELLQEVPVIISSPVRRRLDVHATKTEDLRPGHRRRRDQRGECLELLVRYLLVVVDVQLRGTRDDCQPNMSTCGTGSVNSRHWQQSARVCRRRDSRESGRRTIWKTSRWVSVVEECSICVRNFSRKAA